MTGNFVDRVAIQFSSATVVNYSHITNGEGYIMQRERERDRERERERAGRGG